MRMRVVLPALAALAMISSLAFLVFARPAPVADHSAHGAHAVHREMNAAEMEEWSRAWWASHARVGVPSLGTPAATFTVSSNIFNLDGNTATQVDTARILVGETVAWQWVSGVHTITSGEDGDPDAGTLFDQPSTTTARQFSFAFTSTGTFPFFCRPHGFLQMKGIVIVSNTTDVPLPREALGFTAPPSPNPSRRGVTFGFAMTGAGRARAEVFDASGRRVAVVLNRDLDAGPHVAAWDGRVKGGAEAPPGLYHVRLTLPGYSAHRAVAIAR